MLMTLQIRTDTLCKRTFYQNVPTKMLHESRRKDGICCGCKQCLFEKISTLLIHSPGKKTKNFITELA